MLTASRVLATARLVRPGFFAKDLRRLLCFLWSQARCWELAPSLRSAAAYGVSRAPHLSSLGLSLPVHDLPPGPQQCWSQCHGLSHLMAPSLSFFICRVGISTATTEGVKEAVLSSAGQNSKPHFAEEAKTAQRGHVAAWGHTASQ